MNTMNDQQIAEALSTWTAACVDAAQLEGWDLFDSCGDTRQIRVERIDDTDELPLGGKHLSGDLEAWLIVREGTQPHHVVARAILCKYAPVEWALICAANATSLT
jgi:hypothetical protein